jgi:hypothetical protein
VSASPSILTVATLQAGGPAQRVVHACLPACNAGAERVDHIGIDPQIDCAFRPLQFRASDRTAADFQPGWSANTNAASSKSTFRSPSVCRRFASSNLTFTFLHIHKVERVNICGYKTGRTGAATPAAS